MTPESDIDCVVFGGAHNAIFQLTSAMHKRQNKGEVSQSVSRHRRSVVVVVVDSFVGVGAGIGIGVVLRVVVVRLFVRFF